MSKFHFSALAPTKIKSKHYVMCSSSVVLAVDPSLPTPGRRDRTRSIRVCVVTTSLYVVDRHGAVGPSIGDFLLPKFV